MQDDSASINPLSDFLDLEDRQRIISRNFITICRSALHHVAEEFKVHQHRCENLKSRHTCYIPKGDLRDFLVYKTTVVRHDG